MPGPERGTREDVEGKGNRVTMVMGAIGGVTPELGDWFQQIQGITSEFSVQTSAVLGTAKILHRTLND